jgi:hypothetical protein
MVSNLNREKTSKFIGKVVCSPVHRYLVVDGPMLK